MTNESPQTKRSTIKSQSGGKSASDVLKGHKIKQRNNLPFARINHTEAAAPRCIYSQGCKHAVLSGVIKQASAASSRCKNKSVCDTKFNDLDIITPWKVARKTQDIFSQHAEICRFGA